MNPQNHVVKEPLCDYAGPINSTKFELKSRGYSKKTIDSYLYHLQRFLDHIDKSPRSITAKDIKSYMIFLKDKGISESSINLVKNSIMFYFREVMKRKFMIKGMKEPDKIMPVLSRKETKSAIDALNNPKHKLLFKMLYSTGLRVGAAISLKWEDIDLSRKVGYSRLGKGKKDTAFWLSENIITSLKALEESNKGYIFKGRSGHLSERAAQEIIKKAIHLAGIKKKITPHSLRRSFAVHLKEQGMPDFKIKKLLNHKDIKTTYSYLRPAKIDLSDEINPLDSLVS